MSDQENVLKDLEELEKLLAIAERPGIRSLLQGHLDKLQHAARQPQSTASFGHLLSSAPASSSDVLYSTLSSYYYDQTHDKVKVYVTVEGASAETTSVDFTPRSFDLKVHNAGGHNYRCIVNNLLEDIEPSQSTVIVKPNKVIVVCKKTTPFEWYDLKSKEPSKKAPASNLDTSDPMKGIMDLMKNLYEEGDDEMKKTIAKTWMETQSKVGAGPNPNPMF